MLFKKTAGIWSLVYFFIIASTFESFSRLYLPNGRSFFKAVTKKSIRSIKNVGFLFGMICIFDRFMSQKSKDFIKDKLAGYNEFDTNENLDMPNQMLITSIENQIEKEQLIHDVLLCKNSETTILADQAPAEALTQENVMQQEPQKDLILEWIKRNINETDHTLIEHSEEDNTFPIFEQQENHNALQEREKKPMIIYPLNSKETILSPEPILLGESLEKWVHSQTEIDNHEESLSFLNIKKFDHITKKMNQKFTGGLHKMVSRL